mgnify:CR=1 FL=1
MRGGEEGRKKTEEREKRQDEERHRRTRDHAKARTPRELEETQAKIRRWGLGTGEVGEVAGAVSLQRR